MSGYPQISDQVRVFDPEVGEWFAGQVTMVSRSLVRILCEDDVFCEYIPDVFQPSADPAFEWEVG